jgi:hypothetical protein
MCSACSGCGWCTSPPSGRPCSRCRPPSPPLPLPSNSRPASLFLSLSVSHSHMVNGPTLPGSFSQVLPLTHTLHPPLTLVTPAPHLLMQSQQMWSQKPAIRRPRHVPCSRTSPPPPPGLLGPVGRRRVRRPRRQRRRRARACAHASRPRVLTNNPVYSLIDQCAH